MGSILTKEPLQMEDSQKVLRLVVNKEVYKRSPVPESYPPKAAMIMTECLFVVPKHCPTFEELDLWLKRLFANTIMEPACQDSSNKVPLKKDRANAHLFQVFPQHARC
jgi:hypothetical protein